MSCNTEDYSRQERTFADMCEWWCAKKGIPIGEFYSRSNLMRSTFSRLRTHPELMPRKNTALACAIGLKLDYDQTQDLLKRAGMMLSGYYQTDLIVEEFIRQKIFDIDLINIELVKNNLSPLGTKKHK